MTTPTRAYSVTYGSQVIGGASTDFLLLKEGFGIFESYRRARLSFTFIVAGTSSTDLKDNLIAVMDNIRNPKQRLQIDHPTDWRDYNPTAGASTNTGFNIVGNVEQVEWEHNGPLMRKMRAVFDIELPADKSGQSGRDENAAVTIQYEENRRKSLVLTGTYTALGANDASAQYAASIAAYATSVLPSGTWQSNPNQESTTRDDDDKNLQFSRQYREITLGQDTGGGDNTSVASQSLTVRKVDVGGANTFINNQPTIPLSLYNISYTAVIDLEVTTNSGLKSLWENTLKAHAIAEANSRLGAPPSGGQVDNVMVQYDPENNIISATFDYRLLNGSVVVESSMQKEIVDESGLVFVPITTGRPHQYAIDSGPPSRTLTVTIMEKTTGSRFFNYKPPRNYYLLRESVRFRETTEGNNNDGTIKFTTRFFQASYRYAIGYGGGGGRGTTTVPRGGGGRVGASPAIALPGITNPSGNGL